VGRGRVDAPGHRPRRPRRWRAPVAAGRLGHIGCRRPPRRFSIDISDQGGVRVVDLGHLPCRDAGGRRIVPCQIRVMRASELPPGGLDLRRVGPPSDAKHHIRIALRHARSVPTRRTRPEGCRRDGSRLTPPRRAGGAAAVGPAVRGPSSAQRTPSLDSPPAVPSPTPMGLVTRAGIAAAIAAAQVGLAYRFALAYRARAGYPRRFPPTMSPTDVGLAFETTRVPSGGVELPGWFIPARSGEPGPGVVLIHGWESARDRTLPLVLFLHAAGFHCLTIDIRGHGAN